MPDNIDRNINILVVDDCRDTLTVMKRQLKDPDWEIICAESGDEAMELLKDHAFALIIMDVMMPGRSGFETAEMIRSDSRFFTIPIIFITGMDRKTEIEFSGYGSGAVDVLFRPVSQVLLRSKVSVFVELYRRQEEQKRLETELRQAQKMEAVGTLAGGIAHDFNNILAAIMGYIELAQFDVPEMSPARKSLDQVLKASHRAKRLVSQILAFSRQTTHEKKPVAIRSIIMESMDLLRATLPSTIELSRDIPARLKTINADPTQIHQVVMNLCTNSCHAMGEIGGKIDVSVSSAHISETTGDVYFGLKPGEYLKLIVRDNGCGMDKKTLTRIFDPYFTTKKKGDGTGMGLSVVHGIVKSHGGSIEVQSEPGAGSEFTLYFPVSDSAVAEVLNETDMLPCGSEVILFVDDEEALSELGSKMLRRLGYTVVSETSSIRALKLFLEKPDKFDLVVTDMTMPDMTGLQLSKNIRAVSPEVPIILCTGYHKMIDSQKIKHFGIDSLLLKPLEIKKLAGVIRDVADRKALGENAFSHA